MIVCNPANVAELDRCFAVAADDPRPVYFRIAREPGDAVSAPIFSIDRAAYVARPGKDVTLVTSGSVSSSVWPRQSFSPATIFRRKS